MTATLYRSDYPNHCLTQTIDGVTLVFHRPSGTTYFLDSPLPEMLALLAKAPLDAAGLTDRLCTQLDLVPDAEALTVVEARLSDLVAIGLVQSA